MPDAIKWCDRGILSLLSDLCYTMPKFMNSRFRGSRYHPYRGGSRSTSTGSRNQLSVPRSVVFKHDVAAIAKKVATRQIRSKSELKQQRISFIDLAVGGTVWNWYNPMQFLVRGTGPDQRIGDVVEDVSLTLGFSYFHSGLQPPGVRLWEGTVLRILVFKAAIEVNTTLQNNWTVNTAGTPFGELLAERFQVSNSPVNKTDYTVLFDGTVKSSLQWDVSGTLGIPGRRVIRVPLAKRYVYKEATGAGGVQYSKFNNIYVLVGVSATGTAAADTQGSLQCSGYLNFRDS